jgi:hypothetical protein
MNFRLTTMAAAFVLAGSAFAQAPAQTAPQAQRQPTTAGKPSQQVTPATPAQPSAQKVDPEKEKAIRHLLDLTGAGKMGDNMTEVISAQVKQAMSRNLPAERLEKFMDDFNQKLSVRAPAHQVESAQIQSYADHFTLDDLQGMIHFYESPVGQRMVKALPEVLNESQRTGADIERGAALATLKDMSGDYPELKTMLPSEEPKPSLGQPQPPKPQSDHPQNPDKPQH